MWGFLYAESGKNDEELVGDIIMVGEDDDDEQTINALYRLV
jgi:hypothetical protein